MMMTMMIIVIIVSAIISSRVIRPERRKMKRSTTIRSRTRNKTGTTEIGLKSPGPFAGFVFATGRIRATRHCSRIVDEFKDQLIVLSILHKPEPADEETTLGLC